MTETERKREREREMKWGRSEKSKNQRTGRYTDISPSPCNWFLKEGESFRLEGWFHLVLSEQAYWCQTWWWNSTGALGHQFAYIFPIDPSNHCVRSYLCVFLVSSMQKTAEPTLFLSSSAFYLPSVCTGWQEIDRYRESERESERERERERETEIDEMRKSKTSQNEVTEWDTAISLSPGKSFLKEGEFPPRRIVHLRIVRVGLLMSKSVMRRYRCHWPPLWLHLLLLLLSICLPLALVNKKQGGHRERERDRERERQRERESERASERE